MVRKRVSGPSLLICSERKLETKQLTCTTNAFLFTLKYYSEFQGKIVQSCSHKSCEMTEVVLRAHQIFLLGKQTNKKCGDNS